METESDAIDWKEIPMATMKFGDPCQAGTDRSIEYYIWTKVQSTTENAPKV